MRCPGNDTAAHFGRAIVHAQTSGGAVRWYSLGVLHRCRAVGKVRPAHGVSPAAPNAVNPSAQPAPPAYQHSNLSALARSAIAGTACDIAGCLSQPSSGNPATGCRRLARPNQACRSQKPPVIAAATRRCQFIGPIAQQSDWQEPATEEAQRLHAALDKGDAHDQAEWSRTCRGSKTASIRYR